MSPTPVAEPAHENFAAQTTGILPSTTPTAAPANQALELATPLLYGVSLAEIVFWAAMLSTLVASVMATEQQERIKSGALGAAAGSALGGIGALITSHSSLLLLGFAGSTFGAFIGWLIAVGLSWIASRNDKGQTVLTYMLGGFQAVRADLADTRDTQLLNALRGWTEHYTRDIYGQACRVRGLSRSHQTNLVLEMLICQWLASIINLLEVLFPLANRPQYRSRVTLIVFGRGSDNAVCGAHWLSDSGYLESHRRQKRFGDSSIGYQVLTGELPSPYFTSSDRLTESRGSERPSSRYKPFLTVRVSEDVVLAVDWHRDLPESDVFVQYARALFAADVCPPTGGRNAGHVGRADRGRRGSPAPCSSQQRRCRGGTAA